MNVLEAVANWYGCPYGLKNCIENCHNYIFVDPRPESSKGIGPYDYVSTLLPVLHRETDLSNL